MRRSPLLLGAVIVAACSTGAGSTPSPSPRPVPTPSPVPSASPSPSPFTLDIVSPEEPAAIRVAIPGEIWVVPDPSTVETTAHVTFTATRDGVVRTVERSLPVFPMIDERATDARPYFDRWLAWLIKKHPELGITVATTWQPEFVSTLLVVSHYAYWSKDWEVAVLWHNMIAPYDWTEIQLRHRWTESVPSLAWRIDSVSGSGEARFVVPPEVVVR